MPNRIPVIDLSSAGASLAQRRRLAKCIDDTFRSTGFLLIEGHAVDEDIVANAWRVAGQFFSLPLADKMRCSSQADNSPRGYFPVDSEALAQVHDDDAKPDLKEAFSVGAIEPPADDGTLEHYDFFYGANIWPSEPAAFRRHWVDYFHAMERLSAELMALFALALDLDERYFNAFFDRHVSALRALNYPVYDAVKGESQPRAGAHTDYGSLTILKPDPRVNGLEIQRQDGEWMAAPTSDTGFLINIGDLLARWTGNRWVSTRHRVVCSPEWAHLERRSIAFFQNPNPDAVIECLPRAGQAARNSEHIEAGVYLRQQFLSALAEADP